VIRAADLEFGDRFMGHVVRSSRHRAQAPSKRKVKAQSEIEELREENQRLRELVAHLSKLALERVTEIAEPGEPPSNDPYVGP
jgi:hypothetical protein